MIRNIHITVTCRVLLSALFAFCAAEQTPAQVIASDFVNHYELASRLSYFLWSSMPDGELLALAEQDTLHNPEVLEAQIKRMIADEKSDALRPAAPA